MSIPAGQPPTREQLIDWLNRCIDEGVNLTTWENGFLTNVYDRYSHNPGRSFTPGESETIERIYTERVP